MRKIMEMDLCSSSFEPNLKFVSELKGDLKTHYFEQHEKAKLALKEFSCSLQNVLLVHQKLLNENIELSITNENLKKIIEIQESNLQLTGINAPPTSQILGSSPNCRLKILTKLSKTNNENSLNHKSPSIIQKENVNDFPPIYSEDFNSDIEDGSFIKHKSPPTSVTNSPIKVQSSPVLSKRKKNNSRRSNSSINTSSQSVDSNNDSKVSSANTSSFDKNIDIDHDLSKEFEKEYEHEPLKPIENILHTPSQNNQDKSKVSKILDVSKTNYGKTEFVDKGKKLRQSVLSFKKAVPIVDISIVDLDESLSNTRNSIMKQGSWSETFFDGNMTSQKSDSILMNMKKLNSPKTDFQTKDSRRFTKTNVNNQNTLAKEDEYIEISPMQNARSSSLRNKLSLNKQSDVSNFKTKHSKQSNDKLPLSTSDNHLLQQKHDFKSKTPVEKHEKNAYLANDLQRNISDETYFSQAEMATYKNDFENNSTEFDDDDAQCKAPPAKKILLDSFDIIPGREEKSPGYAYKEGPVRKKSDRDQLPGWDCRDCERYYGHLPVEERNKRMNKCSKHRAKYKPEIGTPESFWDPGFNDTHDSSIFNDN